MKVIISGGGTGGHVFPAIAIANAIKKQRPNVEILFIGAAGKIEMEKVPAAGYPIKGLWISGFQRRLTLQNLAFPFKLIGSLWVAWMILRKFKPNVVIGVGGYASGPTLEIATRMGIPTLVQEQNSFPGITNRLLAKKVTKICVAYQGMDKFFPNDKIFYTGNPVRQEIFENLDTKRTEAYRYFGLDAHKKTIFVFGGSLGARTINNAMVANAALLKNQTDTQVLWQAGKLYIDEMQQSQTANLPNVQVRQFIDRMDLAYAMADVVIGRAGALTISELCFVGKPSILIPSPNVAEDHQRKNAMALVEQDAAVLVEDKDADLMITQALEILNDERRLQNLGRNISQLKKSNAAEVIAEAVLTMT